MAGRTCDVAVVGGGAMGSAAAWQLAERGRDVVLVERFARQHVRGGSHGATRIFRLGYPQDAYVRLGRRAARLWRQLEDATGTTLLEMTGALDHGDATLVGEVAAAFDRNRVAYQRLTPAAAQERFPGMRVEGEALLHAEGGRLWAQRAVRALQDRAAALGADLRFATPVAGLGTEGGRPAVRTGDGTVVADVVVVAAGGWTPALVPHLPLPPVRVTQEQYLMLAPRSPDLAWPSFIHSADPMRYGLATPGEGVKVGEHTTGRPVDPDHRTFDVDPEARDRVLAYAERWLPGLEPVAIAGQTCLYDSTPTEDFVLERTGDVVVATGFSGHGFKHVPAVGEILADLATGGPSPDPRFMAAAAGLAVSR